MITDDNPQVEPIGNQNIEGPLKSCSPTFLGGPRNKHEDNGNLLNNTPRNSCDGIERPAYLSLERGTSECSCHENLEGDETNGVYSFYKFSVAPRRLVIHPSFP